MGTDDEDEDDEDGEESGDDDVHPGFTASTQNSDASISQEDPHIEKENPFSNVDGTRCFINSLMRVLSYLETSERSKYFNTLNIIAAFYNWVGCASKIDSKHFLYSV